MSLEGKILGNRYEIIEKIGSGGMATVYKAKCHGLKRYVAVKVLKDEFTTDEEFVKRFNVEAESVASLTHPNIVSVFDVGNEDNLHYIVMELVQGKTLKDIIIEDGILSWKWSVKIVIQIASALEKAHKSKIIHRDIKPHNILITEEGIAKVTDFGIAKAASNATITAFGSTIGSVHYFSPEHAKGGHTDEKSDLYSLGVVLYEMVTGTVPFDGDTPVAVALKHMQEEPTEAMSVNPDLPVSVNNIVVKAMQKDGVNRYSSATEMIKDLNAALKNPDSSNVAAMNNEFATKIIDLGVMEKKNKEEEKETVAKSGRRSKSGKPPGKIKGFFKKNKAFTWLLILFLAAAIFAGAVWAVLFAWTPSREEQVQIPELVGLTLEEAKEIAERYNLRVEVQEERYHVDVLEGYIISQTPPFQNNFRVNVGRTIYVVVSLGQEYVIVPNLLGKPVEEAVELLREVGLFYDIREQYNDRVQEGHVIEQGEERDTQILAGSTVTIYVSSGIEQIRVPNLLNMSEADAIYAINYNGLTHRTTVRTRDNTRPNGVVVEQEINAGTMVDRGTAITITINEFDELNSATVTVNVRSLLNYTPDSGNPSPSVQLQVRVNGVSVGTRTVPRDSIHQEFPFQERGVVDIEVLINGDRVARREMNLNSETARTIY
ncbi:MAG: Stk1 family PASTA domain-containing Ser/Thr kinase [Oscillospiraceae bacterium]|nr:Stk1 family PASTA domain-containing Ser/Thr kinase [Oscillospiraceae bacterium]